MNKKPILSDHQKKHVLSAKKKQKVVIKNLLVQPFERYWPELTTADTQCFVNAFRSFYTLRASSKTNAKCATTTVTSNGSVCNNLPNESINHLKLGLQSSIRCISSGQRLALFISSKIRPKYIVDQIIVMTLTKNKTSNVFCVPNMDETLFDVLGFSCQCLVLLESENDVWNWSLLKSKEFPLPVRFDSEKPIEIERMDDETFQLPITGYVDDKIDFTTLYLRKENASERAFTPRGMVSKDIGNNFINDFIPLGASSIKIDNIRPKHQMISKIQTVEKPITKQNPKLENILLAERFSNKKKNPNKQNRSMHTNKVNYVALKINRVQPNSEKNRNKNKNKNKK